MKTLAVLLYLTLAPAIFNTADAGQLPIDEILTYQGELLDNGLPVDGLVDLEFSLFSVAAGGGVIATTFLNDVVVSEGRFTAELDFGVGAFAGEPRHIEIGVYNPAGSANFELLTPRQPVRPAPYAIHAKSVDSSALPPPTPWHTQLGGGIYYESGNVGIGTTIPNYDLDIWGLNASLRITGSGATPAYLRFNREGGGEAYIAHGNGNSLYFNIDGADRMTVDGTGRVGIGTSAPQTRLDLIDNTGGTGIRVQAPSGGVGLVSDVGGDGSGVWSVLDGLGSAVLGDSRATSGITYGVRGEADSADGFGVFGTNSSSGGYAVYADGALHVNGTLSKLAGSFKIDHPLDPENRYLSHSFVESPDMMNLYNGNVLTDDQGFAEVVLPDWLETLNRDFRYQLTVIGTFAQAMIEQKIKDNHFTIRTDQPNVEVSWQVTGIRDDLYARAHPIEVESMKPAHERGKYLIPELYGADPTATAHKKPPRMRDR